MKISMKAIILITLLFFLSPFSIQAQKDIKGSGYVLTQQRELEKFTSIELSSGIDMALVQGDLQPVIVESDYNLFPYIKTVVRDQVLKIYIPDTVRITKYADMNVLISIPTLCDLNAARGSHIDASPELWNVESIRLEATSGARIKIHLKSTQTTVIGKTSGILDIKGHIVNLKAFLKTGARLNAKNLAADQAQLHLSTGARAELEVRDSLQYNLVGNARLLLRGNPVITHSQLHSGSKLMREK